MSAGASRFSPGSRLEVTLLICFAASVVLTIWLLYDARLHAQREAEQTQLSIVRTLASDIEHNLQGFERSLDVALTNSRIAGVWDAPPQLRNAAIFDESAMGKLSRLLVIDQAGKLLAKSSELDVPTMDYTQRDYFRFHKENSDLALHISGPFVGRSSGEKHLVLSRRFDDANGNFAGVVAGGISLGFFHTLFGQQNLEHGDVLSLFTAEGRYLMREPFDPSVVDIDARRSPLFQRIAGADSNTFFYRSSYDNAARLVAFAPIGHLPLVLAYARSESAVFAGWQRTAGFISVSALMLWCAQLVVLWQLRRERLRRMAAEQLLGAANRTLEDRVQREVSARDDAQRKLERSQRLEALGQLAGGIAHDMNNVLHAIAGACSLLRRRPSDSHEVDRIVSIVLAATDRGSAVTRRLLAFSRRDQLRPEVVDLEALLVDLRELLNHTLGDRVGVELGLAKELPKLFADRMQLETVLINLATNARDAMPGGGTITITADREAGNGEASEIAELPKGGMIRISVVDTGIGMDANTLARAVEPFYTTKGLGKGTGLGLSMAKGFTEQSGGGLVISSRPSEGTAVTMWLPEFRGSTEPAVVMRADEARL